MTSPSLSPIRKAIAQLLTGIVTWATAVVVSEPGPISASEWVVLLGFAVGAFLVWLIPNDPPGTSLTLDRLRPGAGGYAGAVSYGLLIIILLLVVIFLLTGVLG